MSYQYNPHSHVKVWISNNPSVFMNFENQTRLIDMREKNPQDLIHLIYDSTMLHCEAITELHAFCRENNIIALDANEFEKKLKSDYERQLYVMYKDEINHLNEGGNLGVASDILRWLSPSYNLGSYTDLDVPLATHHAPQILSIDSPLLLNIGTLKLLGNQEMVLALNEYIAVADEEAAKADIEKVQAGIINKLKNYTSDYIDSTEEQLSQSNFLNRILLGYLKNRAESLYIKKSTELSPPNGIRTSRNLRAYVNEVMSDNIKYLEFRKQGKETHQEVITRLKKELKDQISFVKWLFFRKEYNEMKQILNQSDEIFISYMMQKERSLYLKSIVICTTGPIEVGKTLFGQYVMSSEEVKNKVRPYAFSHYDLHKNFLSRNVIPLHENPFNMLRFLGADVGELNDSSWLEEGMSIQKSRQVLLKEKQQKIANELPLKLVELQKRIQEHIATLKHNSQGIFSFIGQSRRDAKINALEGILKCFNAKDKIFDVKQFKKLLADESLNWSNVFAGFFLKRTQQSIKNLETLCHDAIVYRVVRNNKAPLVEQDLTVPVVSLPLVNLLRSEPNSLTPSKADTLVRPEAEPAKESYCHENLFSGELITQMRTQYNSF